MNRELKEKCIAEFEAQIFLPMAYFVKADDHFRIAYHIHDRFHYINAATPLEIAKALRRFRKIKSYSLVGEHITMWQQVIVTEVGPNREPIMYAKTVPITLKEIEFTTDEARRAAALDYWYQAQEKMSAKIINMFASIIKRIA